MIMKTTFVSTLLKPWNALCLLFGLHLLLPAWQISGQCQNITGIEYFFDTDPGFGLGTPLPVTPAPLITNLSASISLDGLSQGFHRLSFRAVDDSGRWSTVQHIPFFKNTVNAIPPDIGALEYFFDSDPGFGLGIPILFNPAPALNDVSFAANVNGLSNGFHFIRTRAMDAAGRWSTVQSLPFFKQTFQAVLPKLTNAEYFIDDDPGQGNATPISFTPGIDKTISWIASIASLNQGFHNLFMRVQDSARRWSLTQHMPFFKQLIPVQVPDIVKVEYFIDHDPGFGMGNDVSFVNDTNNLDLAFSIDIESLSQGFHKLFIRAKDSRGKWSLVQFQPLYKQFIHDSLPELVEVEYFFDTDPGEGNGLTVPFSPTAHIPFLAWSLNLGGISYGQHMLYVRTKDEYGKWSLHARDTIFYYLDSLPTASLSGPQGICINASGQFEVLLTGSPPWNLEYFNGEDTITVQEIMNSPYLFDVAPTWHGTHTARILQVQDVYYTGLYTGIPIEYEVYPLPQAAGNISGSENLCMGSGNNWYWINPVLNATTYQWTYPSGAVLHSNANQNGILLDLSNVIQSGTITVTPVNACGTGDPSSVLVNIRPLPVVDAGPDQNIPFNDSAIMAPVVTGGTEPYTYYWNPWVHLDNPYIPNATAFVNETTVFTLHVTDAYGCQGSDQVTIYVGLPPGTQVEGSFTYNNALMTPLNDATVMLKQGSELIASATTGDGGNFVMQGITAGTYSLSATSSKTWGGVNATDALLVLQHFTSIVFLYGLRLQAADVNATGNINAIDALLIARRYAEIISTFPAGDWLSEIKAVNASGSGSITENLEGIVFGDVNGSYVPAAKLSHEIELQTEGLLTVCNDESFELPLYADRTLEVGALSLELQIPEGLSVTAVRTARAASFEDEAEPVIWNVSGRRLLIAWYSLNPLQVQKGTALLRLRIEGEPAENDPWLLHENSSVADLTGHSVTPLVLGMPAVKTGSPELVLEQNRPNPVSTTSLINFYLPEEGLVKISLKTSSGQTLKYLVREQMTAGWHQITMDAATLSSGMYVYMLEFEGKNSRGMRAGKMMVE